MTAWRIQRSPAAGRWVVLDGQKPVLVAGGFEQPRSANVPSQSQGECGTA
jgi:hypothetical protein